MSVFDRTLEEIDAFIDRFCAEWKQKVRRDRYDEFMQSDAWRDIRAIMLDIYNHKCDTCGSPNNLQVHHKTYERFGGDELVTDLQVLCKNCHARVHGRRF